MLDLVCHLACRNFESLFPWFLHRFQQVLGVILRFVLRLWLIFNQYEPVLLRDSLCLATLRTGQREKGDLIIIALVLAFRLLLRWFPLLLPRFSAEVCVGLRSFLDPGLFASWLSPKTEAIKDNAPVIRVDVRAHSRPFCNHVRPCGSQRIGCVVAEAAAL